jgi:hypothetical protein
VNARVCVDQIAQSTDLKGECRLFEGLLHLSPFEHAQIAPLFVGGTIAMLKCDALEKRVHGIEAISAQDILQLGEVSADLLDGLFFCLGDIGGSPTSWSPRSIMFPENMPHLHLLHSTRWNGGIFRRHRPRCFP